jgi:hypothetical protein
MSDRSLRTLVAVMLVALVVVVALILVIQAGRSGPPTASARPTPALGPSSIASASPSGASGSSATPSASSLVLSTPLPTSSLAASPTPLPVPLATITFLGLKLDATDASGAQPRIVTFASDGPGTVTAHLATSTPKSRTHMCLQVGAKVVGCNDIASGTFTGRTSQAHATWQVTLEGTAAATPVVDLTVTFQALAPAATIQHARFDGTDLPATNGIQARVTARAAGDLHLVASWGGHPFPYEVDLVDETSGTGNASFPDEGPSTNADQSFPIGAGDWRLVLRNTESGFGITDMTATIAWP